MEQLEMAKDAMACEACMGEGCADCQGMGGMNSLADSMNQGQGDGMGAGRGIGDRPDERNATNLRDTRVRQKPRQGAATFGGLVDGPNAKGDVVQSINEELETLSTKPADPLTNERLTKSRRQHAEEYFKLLREGK
jgi:hypothetical protein